MSNRSLVPPALALALILAPALPSLRAQDFLARTPDASAPVPAPPLVRQGDAAAYAATFAYAGLDPASAAAKADPRDARIEVEKAGQIRHEVRYGNGGTVETWYLGREQLAMRNPFGTPMDHAMFYAAALDGSLSFPELSWIAPGNFAGAIRVGQQTIDVYRYQAGGVAGAEPFLFHDEPVTAYVDDATRLPLALKTSAYTAAYTPREAPAELTLPPVYRDAYDQYRKRTGLP